MISEINHIFIREQCLLPTTRGLKVGKGGERTQKDTLITPSLARRTGRISRMKADRLASSGGGKACIIFYIAARRAHMMMRRGGKPTRMFMVLLLTFLALNLLAIRKRATSFSVISVRNMRPPLLLLLALTIGRSGSFTPRPSIKLRQFPQKFLASSGESQSAITSVEEASSVLQAWDKQNNPVSDSSKDLGDVEAAKSMLPDAVRVLSQQAAAEREEDPLKGRCMLGICAPSAEEGIATLKSWVTSLELPRGLLHGMDKDGVPLEITGSVYIKYNTGGVLSFADIRKIGMGFDALWKPGDAMLEMYDGTYRGVYFQVELSDGEFRQYLLPLDTFVA